MIGHLQGRLLLKSPTHSIIDCAGVGYEIAHTPRTADSLSGERVAVFVHTHVREDGIQLFAFATHEERSLFRELTRVSGIGPKLALAMLTAMNPSEIVNAIHRKEIAKLQSIPGIGKKTAERICLDLTDRLNALRSPSELPPIASSGAELESILLNLGYQKSEIQKAVQKVLPPTHTTAAPLEELVRQSLKELSKLRSLS